jgi:uncharacterized alpha-E superfamily protein
MARVHGTLSRVANESSTETLRRAGEIHAALQYGRIEDALETGLRGYLARFLTQTADLGARIANDFLVSEAAG